jgi:hypothetical protein
MESFSIWNEDSILLDPYETEYIIMHDAIIDS